VLWSEEQFRIFGYQPGEIQPTYQHFLDALHVDDKKSVVALLNAALEGRADYKTECRIKSKNGEKRYVLCQGAVYKNEANKVVKMVGTTLDVTERKLAEQEREDLQRQLQHAQKMEAIGLLTGGIAHEFNNILGSILGYTGLTLDRYVVDKTGKMAEYLNEVLKAGQRARDLVIQMMAFSRGGSGARQELPIVPLIKESIKMLRATLPVTIEIRQHFAFNLPTVTIAPNQIQQVLTNLCINARDAMRGKGRLDIGLRTIDVEAELCASCHSNIFGTYLELSVNDSGIGLTKNMLNKIFDPFFSTKEVGKGSGMGLSVVHGIVHGNGGHIVVESQPEHGSSFRLLLPLADQDRTEHPADAESTQATEQIESAHIMVVDDEVSLTVFFAELLRNEGHAVTVFNNPMDAMAFFVEHPGVIDLVITDQYMPQLDGVALAQRLLEQRPNLPVIMCSGYSEPVYEQPIGLRAVFNKPVNSGELIETIKRLLNDNS
jgi:PAS domain S-box-containing protein